MQMDQFIGLHSKATSICLQLKNIIGLNHMFRHVFHSVWNCANAHTFSLWAAFKVVKIYILAPFKDIDLQKRTEQKKKKKISVVVVVPAE